MDTPSKFFVSARGISMQGKPVVHITDPNRSNVRNSVVPAKSGNDGEYEVTFTPDIVGTYDMDIIWNGKHIPGNWISPIIPFFCLFQVNSSGCKIQISRQNSKIFHHFDLVRRFATSNKILWIQPIWIKSKYAIVKCTICASWEQCLQDLNSN